MNNKHTGVVLHKHGKYEIISCNECGFKHVIPLPSDEELNKIYKEEYYTSEKPNYIEKYQKDIEWWNLIYQYRYNLFESFLNNDERKILDIGSGPGHFLKTGKSRGWDVKGLEPNIDASKYSSNLGVDIIRDFFTNEISEQIGLFDVINLGEVLEHLIDPTEFLFRVKYNLNKNGLISIIVPNDYNPFQMILHHNLNFNPWWLAPPYHLNYFSFDSLKILLEKVGFKVLNSESTFPIDIFLLMNDNYIGDEVKGREVHEKRKAFEIALLNSKNERLMNTLYQEFAKLNIGREIFIIAQNIKP